MAAKKVNRVHFDLIWWGFTMTCRLHQHGTVIESLTKPIRLRSNDSSSNYCDHAMIFIGTIFIGTAKIDNVTVVSKM